MFDNLLPNYIIKLHLLVVVPVLNFSALQVDEVSNEIGHRIKGFCI